MGVVTGSLNADTGGVPPGVAEPLSGLSGGGAEVSLVGTPASGTTGDGGVTGAVSGLAGGRTGAVSGVAGGGVASGLVGGTTGPASGVAGGATGPASEVTGGVIGGG